MAGLQVNGRKMNRWTGETFIVIKITLLCFTLLNTTCVNLPIKGKYEPVTFAVGKQKHINSQQEQLNHL